MGLNSNMLRRCVSSLGFCLAFVVQACAQQLQGMPPLQPEVSQNPPVAISSRGEYIAVGSPLTPLNLPVGLIFVYARFDKDCWAPIDSLSCPRLIDLSNFGRALAISGDGTVLAVAAAAEIVDQGNNGAVIMYGRDPVNGKFEQRQVIRNPMPQFSYWQGFGTSLALDASGDYLVVGAPAGSHDTFGYVFIFCRRPLGCECAPVVDYWYLHTFFYGAWPTQFGLFGAAVSISDKAEYVAIGEPGANPAAMNVDRGVGRVYIYERTAQSWRPNPVILNPDFSNSNNGLGTALAISGNGTTLIAGAPNDGTSDTPHVASVYIFERNDGAWKKTFRFDAAQPGTSLGMAVEMSYDGTYAIATDSTLISCFQKTPPIGWQLVGQMPRAFVGNYAESYDTVPTTKAIGLSKRSNFLVAGSGITNDVLVYNPTCSLVPTDTTCPWDAANRATVQPQ